MAHIKRSDVIWVDQGGGGGGTTEVKWTRDGDWEGRGKGQRVEGGGKTRRRIFKRGL